MRIESLRQPCAWTVIKILMREATESRRERRQSGSVSVVFYVHHEIYLRAILFFAAKWIKWLFKC